LDYFNQEEHILCPLVSYSITRSQGPKGKGKIINKYMSLVKAKYSLFSTSFG
jgi:hypothetical protein